MADESILAWLDLETTDTAVDARHSAIIEVGVVFTTRALVPLRSESFVINPGLDRGKRSFINEYDLPDMSDPEDTLRGIFQRMDPVVQMMHIGNGLWTEVQESQLPTDAADHLLASYFDEVKPATGTLSVAGSGVSWFDMRYMQAHFPASFSRVTYFSYDVGHVRRFLRDLCGVDVAPADPQGTSGGPAKSHRALDDAWAHLNEARAYVATLGGIEICTA